MESQPPQSSRKSSTRSVPPVLWYLARTGTFRHPPYSFVYRDWMASTVSADLWLTSLDLVSIRLPHLRLLPPCLVDRSDLCASLRPSGFLIAVGRLLHADLVCSAVHQSSSSGACRAMRRESLSRTEPFFELILSWVRRAELRQANWTKPSESSRSPFKLSWAEPIWAASWAEPSRAKHEPIQVEPEPSMSQSKPSPSQTDDLNRAESSTPKPSRCLAKHICFLRARAALSSLFWSFFSSSARGRL